MGHGIVEQGDAIAGRGGMALLCRCQQRGPGQEQVTWIKTQTREFSGLVVVDEREGAAQPDAGEDFALTIDQLHLVGAQLAEHADEMAGQLAQVQGDAPLRRAPTGNFGGGEIEGARLDEHFQAAITASQVQGCEAGTALQKCGCQRLCDRVHRRWFGAGR